MPLDEVSPDVPAAEPVPPEERPSPKLPGATDVPPELRPELPPDGGVVAEPGLLSLSAGGGIEGVDGAASCAVCPGDGAVLVLPGSVPAPPSLPRLQAVRLAKIKPDNKRIFDV